MQNTPTGKHPSRSAPKSPSWIAERDALRLLGDRRSRAILAIYHARRSAKRQEFFIHPDIAKVNGLKPADLNWALDRLEGVLIVTSKSRKGGYRLLKLLPQFEEVVGKPASTSPQTGRVSTTVAPDGEQVMVDTEAVLARAAGLRTETAHHQVSQEVLDVMSYLRKNNTAP